VIRTYSLMSRRVAFFWIAAALLAGLALTVALSSTQSAKADGHVTGTETLVVTPTEADFEPGKRKSKTKVWLYGSGFAPGQSVMVLVADQHGNLTDIGALEKQDVAANDDGAFGFDWTFGRFTRKGVGGESMVSVIAVDPATFDTIATAPLALCNLKKRKEDAKVPDHCSA